MLSSPIQSANYLTIPLAQINLHNEMFRITTREDVEELTVSIQNDGLINPPTLINNNSAYAIISGFRRVNACQKLGWNEIVARILDPNTHQADCLRLAIAENAFQRQLNLIETSRALHKLSTFFDSDDRLIAAVSTLGLPTHPTIIKKIRKLCLLPQPVQCSILTDAISLSMAGELETLDPDSAVALAGLFDQLKLSLSKQKEILTLVEEIAQREDRSVRQVMREPRLQKLINDNDLDRAQKTRQIRSLLRQWRFPRITKAEKNYQIHHKQLKLGNDIKIAPPKDFEGTTYSLTLNFTNVAQLAELKNRLDQLLVHPSFVKIVEG
jgi:ParB family chromosome partitioning protein